MKIGKVAANEQFEQTEQVIDLTARPRPVFGRKRKKREIAKTVSRKASTPARCPALRGKPRAFAQRPLPSIIMAMWRGSDIPGSPYTIITQVMVW
jgi:hypothetical protein